MPGRLLHLVVVVFILLLTLPAAAQQEAQCILRTRGAERANVRQQPDQGAAVVTRLEPGQVLEAFAKTENPQGAWYQVEAGWVAAWVVEPAGNALSGYLVIKMTGSPYSGAFDLEVPAGTYRGSVCPEIIHGTDANDTIHGNHGDDVLIGYGGNDMLFGDAGDDVLFGGSGSDALYGGGGLNYIYAMSGADRVFSLGSVDDYFMLDGFSPFRHVTREQVNTWFGANVIDTEFARTGVVGDFVITTQFVFLGESQ